MSERPHVGSPPNVLGATPGPLEEHAALRRAVELLTPQHLPIVIVFADPALAATAEVAPVDHGELCRTPCAFRGTKGSRTPGGS